MTKQKADAWQVYRWIKMLKLKHDIDVKFAWRLAQVMHVSLVYPLIPVHRWQIQLIVHDFEKPTPVYIRFNIWKSAY